MVVGYYCQTCRFALRLYRHFSTWLNTPFLAFSGVKQNLLTTFQLAGRVEIL